MFVLLISRFSSTKACFIITKLLNQNVCVSNWLHLPNATVRIWHKVKFLQQLRLIFLINFKDFFLLFVWLWKNGRIYVECLVIIRKVNNETKMCYSTSYIIHVHNSYHATISFIFSDVIFSHFPYISLWIRWIIIMLTILMSYIDPLSHLDEIHSAAGAALWIFFMDETKISIYHTLQVITVVIYILGDFFMC